MEVNLFGATVTSWRVNNEEFLYIRLVFGFAFLFSEFLLLFLRPTKFLQHQSRV